jgi:probable rRNA maturation factor
MNVQYVNRQNKHPIDEWRSLLDQVLPAALAAVFWGRQLQRQGFTAGVTVIFAGTRQMRQINRETRSENSLTDVLSFPLLDLADGHLLQPLGAQDFDPEQPAAHLVPLGDVVISLDRAMAQAAEFGHSVRREVAFLAVHGLLHLLGFDHQSPAAEKKMLRLQKQVLDRCGLGRGEPDA